jgi:putative DNA primase/helicase
MSPVTNYRKEVLRAGFSPVPVQGKRPLGEGWQKLTAVSEKQLGSWIRDYSAAKNTGVLTARTPAFDIDINDPDAAAAVEHLAREHFEEKGDILVRFGRPPKRAILFRTDAPFEKIQVLFGEPETPVRDCEKLEFLGDGQQLVIDGIHPETGKPYAWFGSRPGETRREDLPPIIEEEAHELVKACVALLINEFGYKVRETKKARQANGEDIGPTDWTVDYSDHDSLTAFVMKMINGGTPSGLVFNFCRDQIAALVADPERKQRRLKELRGIVDSAVRKLAQSQQEPLSEPDDDAKLTRLAKLPLLDYERARKEAAEALGMRASMLDRVVEMKRKELGCNSDDGKQGRPIELVNPEPWPEPVDGADILDEIEAALKRFVICEPHARTATALWICATWFEPIAQVAPILNIKSPVMRCGKSTVLSIIGKLAKRPLTASNISASAVYRTIDKYIPTLIIDEADTFFGENEELCGVIDSGHTRDEAFVIRTVAFRDDFEPRRFSTWGFKAIAGIGKRAGQIEDRAITVQLERKLASQKVERLRHEPKGFFEIMTHKLARFSADKAAAIERSRPELPEALDDRQQDNWEMLLAIADTAEGKWPQEARAAALSSSEQEVSASLGEELLADIRVVLTEKGYLPRKDKNAGVPSRVLASALVAMDDRPWSECNRGKELTQNMLARKLKPFRISPKDVGQKNNRFKGYDLAKFEAAFIRYLPKPPSATAHPRRTNEFNDLDEN